MRKRSRPRTEAGTTLIEVLAAVVITALLVAQFVPFVAQVLGRWTTGQKLVEDSDQLMRAIVRLQAEFAGAEIVPLNGPPPAGGTAAKGPSLFFLGDQDKVVLVHPGQDPKLGNQLETLAFTIEESDTGTSLVRRTARFDPAQLEADPHGFDTPNAVLVGAWRMRFSYVGRDGARAAEWRGQGELPARVELSLKPVNAADAVTAPIALNISARGKLM